MFITIVIVASILSVQEACNIENRDCTCNDLSFSHCNEAHAQSSMHTDTLEECIMDCELFSSFNQCDYLIFHSVGVHDNCLLFHGGITFEEYLHTCSTLGKPLFDKDDMCFENSQGECPSGHCLISGCQTCDKESVCNGYRESDCTMTSAGLMLPDKSATADDCQHSCTLKALQHNSTYFTHSIGQRCTCFQSGARQCNTQVVKKGVTWDQVQQCAEN